MAGPDLRTRLRPLELLGLSGAAGLFAGLVVLMSTRDLVLALIFLGIAFIVALVVFAMMALSVSPTEKSGVDESGPDEQP
jgi:hypothetical protein